MYLIFVNIAFALYSWDHSKLWSFKGLSICFHLPLKLDNISSTVLATHTSYTIGTHFTRAFFTIYLKGKTVSWLLRM